MTSPDVLERIQAEHRYQKRLADQIQVTASYDSAVRKRVEMLSDAIAEIERLRASPWVEFTGENYPPTDPDENGSVSIAVLIAYEGDNPNPIDNACYGWVEDKKWYQRGGKRLKSRVLAWLPIPPLPESEHE